MAQQASGTFEIPREMRTFAEQSFAQARKAFDGFMSVAQKAAASIEGQAAAAQTGAEDIRRKAMSFAEQNVASSFDLAEKLMRARDVEEMTRLQADFVQHQMELLSAQAQELGQAATRAAREAGARAGNMEPASARSPR
jgi:phasin